MEPHSNSFDRLSDDLLGCIFEKLLWNPNAFGVVKGRERVRLESVCKRFQELVHRFGSLDWEFKGPRDEDAFLRYMFRQRTYATPLTRVNLEVRSSVNVIAILQSLTFSTQGSLQELHLFVGILSIVKWEYVFLLLTEAQQLQTLDLFLWGREQLSVPLRFRVPWGSKPLPKLRALTLYGFAIPGSDCDQFLQSFPSLETLELHSFEGQTYSFGVAELDKVFLWGNENASFDLRNSARASVPRSLEKVVALMESGSLATREKAVSALLSLSNNALSRKAIAAFPGSLQSLVELMDYGGVPAALATLQKLADEPQNTRIIAQLPGCLQKLLSCLEHYRPDRHEPAAAMLVKFALVAEVGKIMAGDSKVLDRLVKLLDCGMGRAPVLAGWVLLQLASDGDVKASAGEQRCLLRLVALLEDAGVSIRLDALLRVLCNDREIRKSVTSTPTFFNQLVGLLASTSAELQTAAAEALHNMARDDADRKVIVATPQCLESLLKLVGEGEDNASERAARALWRLAGEATVCSAVAADPGALQTLVSRLSGESKPVQHSVVGLLTTLARDPTARQAVARAPGCLLALVSLMKDKRADIRKNVCGMLWQMGLHSATQNEVLNVPEVVSRLGELIGEGVSPGVVEAAAGALQSLAGRTVIRKAIASLPGCLQRLVNLLGVAGRTARLAAYVFVQLVVDADMRKVVIELPEALEKLVGLLSVGGAKGAHEPAARALHSLARTPECRVAIAAAPGCLGKLVGFLSSREKHVQREAEKLLQSLLLEPEVRLAASKVPGMRERLVSLVGRGWGSAPEGAAGVLWQLAAHDAQVRTKAAADAKVVEDVASHPEDASAGLQKVKGEGGDDGAVIRKLTDGEGGDRSAAMQRLAGGEGGSGAGAREEKGFLEALTTFLQAGSKDVRKSIAKALWETGNHAAAVRKAALQVPNLLPALVDLLSEGNAVPVKEAAAGALQSIAQDAEARSAVAGTPGCLQQLGELLESSEGRVSELAACAVSQLAADEKWRKTVVELPGAVEKLVDLLNAEVPAGPHKHAANALRSLVWDGECRLVLAAMPQCLAKLVSLLGAEKEHVQSEAAQVLFGLTIVPEPRAVVWKLSGILERLVSLLGSSSTAVQAWAARVLQNLALDDESRREIARAPGCLDKLFALLESKCLRAAKQSVMALWNLMGDDEEEDDETRALVFGKPGLLGKVLAGEDPEYPTWLLIDLAEDAGIRAEIAVLPGALQKLVELLTQPFLREVALEALKKFAADAELGKAIAAMPDCVPRLQTLAGLPETEIHKEEDPGLRKGAAKVLKLLGVEAVAPSGGAAAGTKGAESVEGASPSAERAGCGEGEGSGAREGNGEKSGSEERAGSAEKAESGAGTAEKAGSAEEVGSAERAGARRRSRSNFIEWLGGRTGAAKVVSPRPFIPHLR
ncbi:hypothetical protein KFL_004190100 [Klebsormidium nitens]|uniref:Uncharacterized protein n=1 Tax=Klebsormidium nitens TaxID=105231 RepID=A0A1Y1IFS2_KLENI|nr:hypothetical protein KFL_004190100 [Klebsormidium nitens]|eukprot:GAQ88339.1 hypothetical protein KFL_004190100 [Klebsormidium nitens]